MIRLKHPFLGRLRIRNKLILTILPCVLVGFATIILIFQSVFWYQVKPMLLKQAEVNLASCADNLKTRVKTMTMQSDTLLYDADNGIRKAIDALAPDMPDEEYTRAYELIRNALNDFLPFEGDAYNSIIRRAFILTRQGEVVSRDSFYASTHERIEQIASAVREPATALHGKLYLYCDPAYPSLAYIARTVYEWQGPVSFPKLDQPIGLWVMEIDLRVFTQILTGQQNPVLRYALLSGGRVIYSAADVQADLTLLRAGDQLREAGTDYRAYSVALGLDDLTLLALMNETLLYSDMQGSFSQWTVIILLCLALVLAAIVLASSSLSRQFDSFICKIRATNRAGQNALVPVSTRDEFGELAQVYNDMMLRIASLHEQVVLNELMVKKAELRSFQAQINPHFLYNTLDCINSLVTMGRIEDTRQTVTALGNIMRMSVKGPDFHPVAREIDYIRQYLWIQKMRYQERILFLLEIPPSLNDYRVPKLVLQPIIENAIIHGVSEKLGQGAVAITGREEPDALIFEIKDNGVGMPESMMRRVNSGPQDAEDDIARGSIGILNIQSRLLLLYGRAYGLHVAAIPSGGTRVTVRLPKERVEETP